MAEIGEPVLDGRYVLLRQVKGCIGGARILLGDRGICRYCGGRNPKTFRKIAHAIPEALGNKWIISADECDVCNHAFSLYDDALATSVSPLLTLGGTAGKSNKVRQTGRTAGDAVIRRDGRGLSISTKADPKDHVSFDPDSGRFRLAIPVAGVPFRPRHAYKALSKIGVALLPDDELNNYQRLRAWLLDVGDTLEFPVLDVAMSFGAIGHAPPLVAASLLRRINPQDDVPHILLILCAGSVCLQIDLMSDYLDHHVPPTPMGSVNIKWSLVLAARPGRDPVEIDYGAPIHQNWSASETTPQPIETMVLDFNPQTSVGRFTPVFRAGTALT